MYIIISLILCFILKDGDEVVPPVGCLLCPVVETDTTILQMSAYFIVLPLPFSFVLPVPEAAGGNKNIVRDGREKENML